MGEPCWILRAQRDACGGDSRMFWLAELMWQNRARVDKRNIECHKVPCRNHGPSLDVVLGYSGPPESPSIDFVVEQSHTPQSATSYDIHDSIQCDQNASLACQGPWFLRSLNVWSHLKPQLKFNSIANRRNGDMMRYLQKEWYLMVQCWLQRSVCVVRHRAMAVFLCGTWGKHPRLVK